MLQRMLLSLLLLTAILAPTAGHAESCSSWGTNSSTFLFKLDPSGAELPGWTYTRSGGATTFSLDGSNLLIGEFQSYPNVGLLMFGGTAGAGPTSTREPYAPPGGATVLSEGRVVGTGAGRFAIWTSFAPFSSGGPTNPTCFVAQAKTSATTVATLQQSGSLAFANPATLVSSPSQLRFTMAQAITDNYQSASLTGKQLAVGYLRYYTTCTPSCTGLTASTTWLMRGYFANNNAGAGTGIDTPFRDLFQSTRPSMRSYSADREEGHVIAPAGSGYIVGGYGHLNNLTIPVTPAYHAVLFMRVADTGSMAAAAGGGRQFFNVTSVMGAYNEARVYAIAPYDAAGKALLLATVRDTTAATPYARRERAFLLRTDTGMGLDATFGTGGIAPVANDNGTVGYLPQNFAVAASGAITVAINSAAGTGNGVRVQRFTAAGQPDLAFAPAGLKVLPLTGCTNPFVDSLFVVLDSAGNAYLTGSGRTN